MSLSDLKRRLFGAEQTPLNPGGTPVDDAAGLRMEAEPRRGKLLGVGIFALCAVVLVTLMRNPKTAATPAATAAPARTDVVHTGEPTTTEAFLNALKTTKLPELLGAPDAAGMSDGDKERAQLALAAWERQHGSSPVGAYGQAGASSAGQSPTGGGAEDPIVQEEKKQRLEQKKKEYAALFANPVIAVGGGEQAEQHVEKQQPQPTAIAEDTAQQGETLRPNLAFNGKDPNKDEGSPDCVDVSVAGEDNETRHWYCLPQGTIIPARLTTRAIGDLPGPVKAVVARDVYSLDRQHVLIPGGAELVGQAHQQSGSWQERLSVTFDRMLLPDGRSIGLAKGLGLDQYGSMGLKDKVGRHIGSKVLTVLTLGGLSALAGAGTGGYNNASYNDMYRQSVSQNTAQVGQQMIGRQLNRPNSLTIQEGKIFDLWVSKDIYLKEWGTR